MKSQLPPNIYWAGTFFISSTRWRALSGVVKTNAMVIVICVPECIFLLPPVSPSKHVMASWSAQPVREVGTMDVDIDDEPCVPVKKKVDLSSLSESEQDLLILLVELGVRRIEPDVFRDSKEMKELKKASSSLNEHKLFAHLKSMSEKGIIDIDTTELVLQCPQCRGQDIRIQFSCQKCGSKRVQKSMIIEHPFCGFKGTEKEFRNGDGLLCPNCKKALIQRVDQIESKHEEYYKVIGSIFECEGCKNKMSRPEISFTCSNCGTQFSYVESVYEGFKKYLIPDDVYEQILHRNDVRVLIVEDFEPEADVMGYLIDCYKSEKKFNVDYALTGKDAISMFRRGVYDVVILDLTLPDIYGLDVLKEMKKYKPDVHIVIVTGHDNREIAVHAMKMGASEYIIKTSEAIQNIPVVIERLLSGKKEIV
jgi:ActR/RegA family two-component response regulator